MLQSINDNILILRGFNGPAAANAQYNMLPSSVQTARCIELKNAIQPIVLT